MTAQAKIIQFNRHQGASEYPQEPQKGAQLEYGYTRIANELFEAVTNAQTCPVTIRQMRVILAVIRMTYGFQKKSDRISDGQIAKETGLSRQNVNAAKHQLIDMRILFLDGRKLGVNKHFQDWDFSKKQKNSNLRQTRDTVSNLETKSASKPETHQRKKENKDLSKDKSIGGESENRSDVSAKQNKIRPDAAVQTPDGKIWGTADDLATARYMADCVAKLEGGDKSCKTDKELCRWSNEIRLLRGRKTESGQPITDQHIRVLWDYANQDAFWRTNILSPRKLAEKWKMLAIKRRNGSGTSSAPSNSNRPGFITDFSQMEYGECDLPDWAVKD